MLYEHMWHSEEAFHPIEEERFGAYSHAAVSGNPVGPGNQAGSSVTLIGCRATLPSSRFRDRIDFQNSTQHRLAICTSGSAASSVRRASPRCVTLADRHPETANHSHGLLRCSGGKGALDDPVNR